MGQSLMSKVDRNEPKRGTASESTYSLMEFMREFPDDAACLDWLWRQRFAPDGHTRLPEVRPGRASFHRVNGSPVVRLRPLRPPRSPDGRDDLPQVLHVAAPVVLRDVPHGQHSMRDLRQAAGARAWRDLQDRMADVQPDPQPAHGRRTTTPLSGEVEADETWHRREDAPVRHGARPAERGVDHRPAYAKPRATVFGAVERGGRVVAMRRAEQVRLHAPSERRQVRPAGSTSTPTTTRLQRRRSGSYPHHRINHSARVYVDGDVHTQTIEGFFSLVKNGDPRRLPLRLARSGCRAT